MHDTLCGISPVKRKGPVAFLDSGVGGISVLREAVRLMPNEDFIYFGDSANAPYGTKPTDTIRSLMDANVRMLRETERVKGIVIACNTATGAAVKYLRLQYPDLPVVGVEPALKPAVLRHQGGKVMVMATPLTLKQPKFQRLLSMYQDKAQVLLLPCPGLMDFVEQGILDGPELERFLHGLLDPVNDGHIAAVVLGCTHYPFLKKSISAAIGYPVEFDDGAAGTAREIKRRLEKYGCSAGQGEKGTVRFFNSLNEKMVALSSFLFHLNDTAG